MQERKNIPQHNENLSPGVGVEAAESGSTHRASEPAAVPEQDSGRGPGAFRHLSRWIAGQIVRDAPEDSALCEFDCRKG
jgi:hypothetical protein